MGNLGTKEQRSKSVLFLKKINFYRGRDETQSPFQKL
jgi:hypothetical protein